MAARFCSYCGSPLVVGASSCPACRAPLGSAAPAAPGAAPADPPMPPPPEDERTGPPPVPGRRRRWVVVMVAAVATLLVLGGVLIYDYPGGYPVDVAQINFVSPDNSCGLDGATDNGFNATTGDALNFAYPIVGNASFTGSGTLPCAIHSVTTPTSGFTITGADVPLVVGANATQTLSYVVTCPPSSFVGDLTVVIT